MERPTHTRSKSSFSFRSTKSAKSDKSAESGKLSTKPKVENLVESPSDKRKSRLSDRGIANPNRAIIEAQPSTLAQESSTLTPLRSVQFKDAEGNVITDPDASNPGRPRMERPLDTIRSFEAAIDASWQQKSRNQSSDQSEAASGYNSRRSSVVGGKRPTPPPVKNRNYGYDGPINQRYGYNGYGPRYPGPRHASYDAGYAQQNQGYLPRRPYNQRAGSAPMPSRLSYEQTVYPSHGYQESYDTVNTGTSSGSASEPWANSTDPSSENSSIDRHTAKQMESGDAYGQGPSAYNNGAAIPNGQYANQYGVGPNQSQTQNPAVPVSPINSITEEHWSDARGYQQVAPPQQRQPPNPSYDRPFAAQGRSMPPALEPTMPRPNFSRPPMPPGQSQPPPNAYQMPPPPMNRPFQPQQGSLAPVTSNAGQKDKQRKLTRPPMQPRQQSEEKRKSWFKRIFS